jgi:hypothetical protein
VRVWATGVSARPYILIRQPDLQPGLQMLLELDVVGVGSARLLRQPDFGCRGAHDVALLVGHLLLDLDQVTASIIDPLVEDFGALDGDVT